MTTGMFDACVALGCGECLGRADCELVVSYRARYPAGVHGQARGDLDVWFPRQARPEPPPDNRTQAERIEAIHDEWRNGEWERKRAEQIARENRYKPEWWRRDGS
jgi:hypothetical protein